MQKLSKLSIDGSLVFILSNSKFHSSSIQVPFKFRVVTRDQSNFPLGPALYRWRGDEMFPLFGGFIPYLSRSAWLPDILHHLWGISA